MNNLFVQSPSHSPMYLSPGTDKRLTQQVDFELGYG